MTRRITAQMSRLALPATMSFKRSLDTIEHLLTETDTSVLEFVSSTILFYLGLLLALPYAALDPAVPLFHSMVTYLPEPVWAALFLTLGALQSWANLTRNRAMRRYAAFWTGILFLSIGVMGAAVHPISLGGGIFKVHALGQFVVFLHLGERGAK